MEDPEMALLERHLPILVGILVAVAALIFLPSWQAYLAAQGASLDRVLGPVFDLATFSAGSLFAIYVLALSRSDGFVGSIFRTDTFRMFHSYVAKSILLCVVATAWTVGYIVVGLGDVNGPSSLVWVSLWVGLIGAAFASVGRVVLVFMVMVGAGTKRPVGKPIGQAS
jgi:hypothetical protein